MDPRNHGAEQRSRPVTNTSNTGAMPRGDRRRFSYAETPIAMQQGQEFPMTQRYAHTQDLLREAERPVNGGGTDRYHLQTSTSATKLYQDGIPVAAQQPRSPGEGGPIWAQQRVRPSEDEAAHEATIQQMDTQPFRPRRMSSPYGVPEPTGVHPAYYAPVVSQTPAAQAYPSATQQPQHTSQPQFRRQSTIAMQSEDSRQPPTPASPIKQHSIQPDYVQIPYSPRKVSTQPIFAPSAATGPNGLDPFLHQPGQLAHPNMNSSHSTGDRAPFENTLCGCSSDVGTCMTGVFCPCILDSRTSYRLGRRKAKLDPTDMLGFKTCNGRCGVMGVFGVCGLCCECSLVFSSLQGDRAKAVTKVSFP